MGLKIEFLGEYSHIETNIEKKNMVDFPAVFLDEKITPAAGFSKEEAVKEAKRISVEGYNNFIKTIPDRKEDQAFIKKSIESTRYIGEISRYYCLTNGVYDILMDRETKAMYFIIRGDVTYVEKVDVNARGFICVYISQGRSSYALFANPQ